MQSRARFTWRADTGRTGAAPKARSLATELRPAPARGLSSETAGRHKPAEGKSSAPQTLNWMLEGFCPEPSHEDQIAVNSNGLMLSLRLADIEWMEATDNCVKLHVKGRTHRLRDALAVVAAKLPLGRFLRISRSTLVNVEQISGLQRMFFDEYEVLLRNGTRLPLTRAYRENLRQSGLPLADSIRPLLCARIVEGNQARN